MQTALTNRFGLSQARAFGSTIPGKLTLGIAATVVIALAAHVAFLLPFTPVPFTLQPLAVLGVGLAFGPVGGISDAAGLPRRRRVRSAGLQPWRASAESRSSSSAPPAATCSPIRWSPQSPAA